jgi:hypothetical protein
VGECISAEWWVRQAYLPPCACLWSSERTGHESACSLAGLAINDGSTTVTKLPVTPPLRCPHHHPHSVLAGPSALFHKDEINACMIGKGDVGGAHARAAGNSSVRAAMASLSDVHHACMAAPITRLVGVRRAQAALLYGVRDVFVSGAVCVCPRNIRHA